MALSSTKDRHGEFGFAPFALAAVWISCFVLSCILLLLLTDRFHSKDQVLPASLISVSELYGPYISVVLGALFGSRISDRTNAKRANQLFYLALGCTFVWNVLVLLPLALMLWKGDGNIPNSLEAMGKLGAKLSFLVAAVLSYYFASGGVESVETKTDK